MLFSFFFFKQKTAYEMRISDWSSDVCSSDLDGLPMWGNALPWKTTELTPNLGRIDATDDMRPGMGEGGVANLRKFVREGGLLVAAEDSAVFAIDVGLAPGVFVTPTDDLKVVGSV